MDADQRPGRAIIASGAPHVTGAPTSPDKAGVDPVTAPLTYPGTPPRRPAVLVTDTAVLPLQPRDDAPFGNWLLGSDDAVARLDRADGDTRTQGSTSRRPEAGHADAGGRDGGHADADGSDADGGPGLREVSLGQYLRDAGGSPAASRTPVLAVGSNASPAQLRRKLAHAGLATLLPITAVSVAGLAVGVSAHVSRPGYLPATPVPDESATSDLWVVWLDLPALAAIDATEPNYERIRLPARYPVRLTTGQPVTSGWIYRSRHGYLVNQNGEPRRLTDQATLISALLAGIPALRPLAGTSPQEWIERTRDAAVRDAIRDVFRSTGLVRRTAGL